MLDTLKASHDLRKAGFDEQQAEAHIAVVRDATAFDVRILRRKKIWPSPSPICCGASRSSNTDTLKWVIGMIMGSTLINVATMIALVKLSGTLTKIAALFPPRS